MPLLDAEATLCITIKQGILKIMQLNQMYVFVMSVTEVTVVTGGLPPHALNMECSGQNGIIGNWWIATSNLVSHT